MQLEISWISIFFGAFGLGVLQLSWETIKFFILRRDQGKKSTEEFHDRQRDIESLFNDLISGAVNIQELIEEFIIINGAARILLMKFENGGGVPQLGTLQHVSVLNEAINPAMRPPDGLITPIKHNIQNYVIDPDYQKIILRMITDKMFVVMTTDLENTLMKKIYESSNVKKSIFIPITQIPAIGTKSLTGFLIYMSIEFTDDRQLDSLIESNIIMMQGKIKNIFHEFYIKRISTFDK